MSVEFLENLVSTNLTRLGVIAFNGACRILSAPDAEATDEQGFTFTDYSAQTESFIPCSWTSKSADEKEVAEVVRGRRFYEITIAQTFSNQFVEVTSDQRLELKLTPDATETETTETVSVINQGNVAWLIYAVDTTE